MLMRKSTGTTISAMTNALTSCSTQTQLRAASMWFAAQTYHMLALLRWAGVQGVMHTYEH